MKANVYIDGFNLYYAIRSTPYKWLDLGKLCKALLSGEGHRVNRIRYFTALLHARSDPGQAQRQQVYLRALETIPGLSIHYGTFLSNTVMMPLAQAQPGQPAFARVLRTAEKGSDVNLATHLLVDAYDRDFEVAAVLSNDSDLVEPIRMAREKLGLGVGVLYPPTRTPSSELGQVASFRRQIRERVLRVSQFPDTLADSQGVITKPTTW